ncbi:MAG: immunity 53 family protein [Oscillospiraceae bacterium]|nr:immunity 53 family protein [Oscillospiraceae bacterium]
MELFDWLTKWFQSYCDGDWEHSYGITIETLDNPGWWVKIYLWGTDLENKDFAKVTIDDGDDDWISCKVENYFFEGFGDLGKLKEIITIFKNWVEA